MSAAYDTIGVNYSDLRRPDPRIEARISEALGPAQSILNVGAGSGSYEPSGRQVTSVEPSMEMIRQRTQTSGPAIQGCAEDLPFDDDAFDASMAVLTVHHWLDKAKGFGEMRRVTRGPVVTLTFDPDHRGGWLNDYFPALVALDDGQMPRMTDYEAWLGPVTISTVPVPHDCVDGFLYAYWRRPAAYLDPRIRAAMSSFWKLDNIGEGLANLSRDLETGAWADRYADLLDREAYDTGYRLVSTR